MEKHLYLSNTIKESIIFVVNPAMYTNYFLTIR